MSVRRTCRILISTKDVKDRGQDAPIGDLRLIPPQHLIRKLRTRRERDMLRENERVVAVEQDVRDLRSTLSTILSSIWIA